MEKSEKHRYTYRKVGKMRIKMRSRVHIFLFGVSEFHPCLGDIGRHRMRYVPAFFLLKRKFLLTQKL